MKNLKLKYFVLVFFLIGLLGGILFFPVNLNDQYTCLYHRLSGTEHVHDAVHHSEMLMGGGNHDLLDAYVASYAVYWWASLAVIAIAIILIKKYRNKPIISTQVGGGNV